MSRIEIWLESNKARLQNAGFDLEVSGDKQAVTIVAEGSTVVFSIIEWPGMAIEFNALSY